MEKKIAFIYYKSKGMAKIRFYHLSEINKLKYISKNYNKSELKMMVEEAMINDDEDESENEEDNDIEVNNNEIVVPNNEIYVQGVINVMRTFCIAKVIANHYY